MSRIARQAAIATVRLGVLAAALAIACAAPAAAASSPAVSTGSHKHATQTTIVLTGTVNPNGSHTSVVFRWGLTTAYGLNSKPQAIGGGTKPVPVKAKATHLIPGTVYHYQLIAFNRFGFTFGRDRTFKTAGPPPPQVATGPATQTSTGGVLLTGIINPNGASTGWRFQYGLTSAYTTATNGGTVAAGKTPVVVTERLAGLAPGTIFHYRLVAFHGTVASSDGQDAIFMTEPSPRPRPRLTVTTRPRRAARRPFVFTTAGRIRLPASIPAQFGCSGSVAVRFFTGHRGVSFLLVPVAPDCTYSGQTVFARRPARGHGRIRLRVAVRFRGNGYVQSVGQRRGHVTLG